MNVIFIMGMIGSLSPEDKAMILTQTLVGMHTTTDFAVAMAVLEKRYELEANEPKKEVYAGIIRLLREIQPLGGQAKALHESGKKAAGLGGTHV